MRTYLWDFFGPEGEETAKHFCIHLNDFLAKESIGGCQTGVGRQRPGHTEVWCIADPKHETILRQALKPNRMLPGEHPSRLD